MGFYEKELDALEDRLRAAVPGCDHEREGMAYHAVRLLALARQPEAWAYERDLYNVLREQVASIEQVVKDEAESLAEYEREQFARETEHPL